MDDGNPECLWWEGGLGPKRLSVLYNAMCVNLPARRHSCPFSRLAGSAKQPRGRGASSRRSSTVPQLRLWELRQTPNLTAQLTMADLLRIFWPLGVHSV